MKPKEFPEQNKILDRPHSMSDEECQSLPVWSNGLSCISLWKMSWRERFAALFFGKVWLSVLTSETQPPVWLACVKTIFED